MKLIFGLGNPGKEYNNTRHNIGFELIDKLANKYDINKYIKKFNAEYAEINIDGEKVLLIKPLSYINLSGGVVKRFVSYYKVNLDDIMVVHDDLDMELGKIKIVIDSSSGGHNGIKDIERNLGTQKYPRLKIGISNNKEIDTKDYVLDKFNNNERRVIEQSYDKLDNLIEDILNMSILDMMSKYNKK